MKKSIFAVCDLDASYAYNLMEAIDERQGMSFEVQAFTNVESLISYARERHIELLLISAAAMCGELLKLSIGKNHDFVRRRKEKGALGLPLHL
ncbi:MAG: hypothetical protein ACLR2E_15175 [Lachnospiraceae bacterium]